MISVRKVIFPGIFAGCIFLVFATNMIANPKIALAFENPAPTVVAAQKQAAPADQAAGEKDAGSASQLAAGENAAAENQPAAANQPAAKNQPAAENQSAEAGGCSISQAYPDSIRQWCDLIVRYAGENSLDPNLVAAVMLQESGGNSRAYSKSGAVGLLQVMPRDGKSASFMCINGPCFSSRPTTEELYDPEFNVSYGTRMLAGLIQKNGDVREALRAYGPMNMGYRYADIILSILQRYQ